MSGVAEASSRRDIKVLCPQLTAMELLPLACLCLLTCSATTSADGNGKKADHQAELRFYFISLAETCRGLETGDLHQHRNESK